MSKQKRSLAEQAAEQIKKEAIKPRSRTSVVAEQLGYALLFGIVFFTLVLAVNWIGFWFRTTGNAVFLGQGPAGIGAFFLGFPFGLVILLITAFAITLLVLRHYDVSYKQPFLLLAALLLLGGIVLGAGMVKTGINEEIAERVSEGKFKPLRPIYEGRSKGKFSQISGKGLVGRVEELGDQSFMINTPNQTIEVRFSEKAKIMGGELIEGKGVHVLGKRTSKTEFEADVILVDPRPQGRLNERKFHLPV